jgi:hypothetical protein
MTAMTVGVAAVGVASGSEEAGLPCAFTVGPCTGGAGDEMSRTCRPVSVVRPAANVRPVIAIFEPENLTLYRILYLVHLVSIVAAFGPLFFYPRMHRAGETQAMAALHMKLVFPSLVVLWVAGMGMAGVAKFSLGSMHWITITIVLWLAALLVSWFLIRPAIHDTSDDARKKMAMGVGITHLVFVVSLLLMIFKPFVDGRYVLN